jgi:hypothetical protein
MLPLHVASRGLAPARLLPCFETCAASFGRQLEDGRQVLGCEHHEAALQRAATGARFAAFCRMQRGRWEGDCSTLVRAIAALCRRDPHGVLHTREHSRGLCVGCALLPDVPFCSGVLQNFAESATWRPPGVLAGGAGQAGEPGKVRGGRHTSRFAQAVVASRAFVLPGRRERAPKVWSKGQMWFGAKRVL